MVPSRWKPVGPVNARVGGALSANATAGAAWEVARRHWSDVASVMPADCAVASAAAS